MFWPTQRDDTSHNATTETQTKSISHGCLECLGGLCAAIPKAAGTIGLGGNMWLWDFASGEESTRKQGDGVNLIKK